jgi:hypothetical protein
MASFLVGNTNDLTANNADVWRRFDADSDDSVSSFNDSDLDVEIWQTINQQMDSVLTFNSFARQYKHFRIPFLRGSRQQPKNETDQSAGDSEHAQ